MPDEVTTYLDEVQARADAATKGPWESRPCSGGGELVSRPSAGLGGEGQSTQMVPAEDAAFTAHARFDVPRLEAAVRAVHDIPEKVRINISGVDVVPVEWVGGALAAALM